MTVDQLPGRVREFANHLDGLLARLDRDGGWCAVFWQRDPDGMRACLDGLEVPPWDVVAALLQDFASAYGPETAARAAERTRRLHAGALAAHDARPGAREDLGDRLDAMLREQRYAAERLAQLGRAHGAARSRAEADSLGVDLAWARDDHERAAARCAELRDRIARWERRAAAHPSPRAADPTSTIHTAPAPAPHTDSRPAAYADSGPAPYADPAPATNTVAAPAAYADSGRASYVDPAPAMNAVAGSAAYADSGRAPYADPAPATNAFPAPAAYVDPGPAQAAPGPAHDFSAPAQASQGPAHAVPSPAYAASEPVHADLESTAYADPAPAAHSDSGPAPDTAPVPPAQATPASAHPLPSPAVPDGVAPGGESSEGRGQVVAKRRKRRRGSARFAGLVEDEAAPGPPPGAPAQAAPVAAAGRRTPRGARFAGAAEAPAGPEPAPEEADEAAGQAVADAVARLERLRAEGRTGEAHALLAEAAHWPAPRFPLLADALHRAGLDADWTTLLWETASLPAARLVAAADALTAAGRTADGRQVLRQGVVRPASEIGEAVLALDTAGRHREADALLDSYVEVRPPQEAAHSAEPDPRRLVPLLLRSAERISDQRRWDLLHALRVAGLAS
ncbi:hypothetical protein AB0N99_29150 [Streptomyces sp. NPDC093272]|uniref:hypothetical protein n=1 Tax=Streptomyces sp. NPDC093272 TaxID=3154981 RepID=UPI0034408B38